MPRDRDLEVFNRRAGTYEQGRLAAWHRLVIERSIEVALAAQPAARNVLDIGCGTGELLRLLRAAGLRPQERRPIYNLGPVRLVQAFVAIH